MHVRICLVRTQNISREVEVLQKSYRMYTTDTSFTAMIRTDLVHAGAGSWMRKGVGVVYHVGEE